MASQYRDAHQALLALDPTQKLASNWGRYFLPLNDRDLRAPMRDVATPSEGQTQYPWIWVAPHPPPLSFMPVTTPSSDPQPPTQAGSTDDTTSDADSQDFDRVQWAKCQARAERYEEEVQLTVEEMGRTLRYFEWKRDWWLSLMLEWTKCNHPPDIQDGLHAYACRQSHLYNELVTLFVTHWRTYLSAHSIGSSWLSKYDSRANPTPTRPSRGHRKVDVTLAPVTAKIPGSSKLPINPRALVDAPLDSGSDDDSEGDIDGADAGDDTDDSIDAEDMFVDD